MGTTRRTLIFPFLFVLLSCAGENNRYDEKQITPSEGSMEQNASARVNPDITTAFENKIAEKLFSLAIKEISNASPESRSSVVDSQVNRLLRSIDIKRLSEPNKLQLRLFKHLQTHHSTEEDGVARGAEAKSTELLTETDYYTKYLIHSARNFQNVQVLEDAAQRSLDDEHQIIRTLNQLAPQDSLETLFEKKRSDKTEYFSNDHQGRQDYLSQIVSAVLQIELLLPSYIRINNPGELAVEGTRDRNRIPTRSTTYYDASSRTILIDITDMGNLPIYEIESLALYFGVPGQHALHAVFPPFRVQQLIHEPGHAEGWAGYALANLNRLPLYQHPTSVLHRAYFQTMLTSLAIIDINIHTKGWTHKQSVNFALKNTPFPLPRLDSLVREAARRPGRFAVPFLVTQEFNDLKRSSEQRLDGLFDLVEFNTMLLGIGEMPMAEIGALVGKWQPTMR